MHINKSFNQRNMLEKMDMFGIDISIRFCKQMLHKTQTGGIISILIIGLIFLQIMLIIEQFIDKTNPQVLYQQSFTQLPERYDLKRDVFTIALGLTDSKSVNYRDESIYKITAQLRIQQRVFNSTKNGYDIVSNDRTLKMEQCAEHHFTNPQTRNYYLQLDYKSLYCISMNEPDLFLEGQFDSSRYSRMLLMVDTCQNSTTSSQVCRSQDAIDKKITNNRLTIYIDDYSVVTRDKDNPFQAVGRQIFWISGPSLYKNTNLLFRNNYLYTDNGYMMQDIQKQRILSYSSDKEQATPRSTSRLYDCYVSLDKNVYQEYHRQYMKIDKAISQLGGIYNILFTIGCLLCKPISQAELDRKLLNSLFSFVNSDDDDSNDEKHKKRKQKEDDYQQEQQQQQCILTQFETHTLNNDNHSVNLGQFKKSDTTINNGSKNMQYENNQGESFQLQKQQSNKLYQTDSKGIQIKKLISEINNNCNKESTIEITNQQQQRDRNNTYFVDQKNEQDENYSFKYDGYKPNSVMGNSISKSQTQRQDEDQSKRKQGHSLGKSSIFNLFKKKGTTIQNNELFKKIHNVQQLFNNNIKEITLKSSEFIISSFSFLKCLRKRKHTVIKYGIQKLYQHIDIFYITTKLIELEKLKSLLLNSNQLKMFEFIPRPVLKFSENGTSEFQQYNGIKGDDKDWYDKMIQAQEALKQIISKGSQISYIDKRLVEILHPKFKNINFSQLNDTSKDERDNFEDVNSFPEIEEVNDRVIDRNQVRSSVPIQEKDFKNINLSIDRIIH